MSTVMGEDGRYIKSFKNCFLEFSQAHLIREVPF